jgi:hypothetical protein
MPGADPVQQIVHYFVFETVADGTTEPCRADPALLPQYAQRLGDRILRSTECSREVTDANSGCAVQAQQDLQAVGIGKQIEALGPPSGVDVGQRRCRTLDLVVLLVHR